jgi:menaquinone-dependent protoporphyrinogen oxidase
MERNNNNVRDIDRRSFLILSTALVAALALPDIPKVRPGYAAEAQFPEGRCGAKKDMGKRMLVAYASRYGSTGGVADAIGKELCKKDVAADVTLARNAGDLGSYRGVVIGSAIYRGKWMSEAADFVKRNKDALSRMPVAYFLVCMTMAQPTEKRRAEALSYMDPILKAVPEIKPVAIGLFAGALDYSKLSWFNKEILKSKGTPEGDFRDWEGIRAWAQDSVYTRLTG